MSVNLMQGSRRQGAVTNLAAAGAGNAVAILTISTLATMVGTKTFLIKRLMIRNNGCGDTWLHIGTGVGAGVDSMPAFRSISNTTDVYGEWELPIVQFAATIVAWPEAVGAGTFDVQVDVEELG